MESFGSKGGKYNEDTNLKSCSRRSRGRAKRHGRVDVEPLGQLGLTCVQWRRRERKRRREEERTSRLSAGTESLELPETGAATPFVVTLLSRALLPSTDAHHTHAPQGSSISVTDFGDRYRSPISIPGSRDFGGAPIYHGRWHPSLLFFNHTVLAQML